MQIRLKVRNIALKIRKFYRASATQGSKFVRSVETLQDVLRLVPNFARVPKIGRKYTVSTETAQHETMLRDSGKKFAAWASKSALAWKVYEAGRILRAC